MLQPGLPHRVDPGLVATALGLTPTESQVAAWLAEGKSVCQMAEAAGHTTGSISRQVDLVLSIAEFG